jgi:NDP-sugar pyrophosphorylase family protein
VTDSKIRRAVILAAGRGTRMGAITNEIPKPMLPLGGKPMLEHILGRLSATGVEEFFVVVGYRHEVIESHFESSPYQITFRVQKPVNGTASAALLAEDFGGRDSWLLTYADILCEPLEYERCGLVLRQNEETAAVLAVKRVEDPWQGAAVYEDDGRITRIVEKPPRGTSTTSWNSAGIYVFRPIVFDYLRRVRPSARNEYELTSALDMMLSDGLELRISPIEGEWRDVGRPEDLAAVAAEL